MFIAKHNDLIILAKNTREELEQALQFMVYDTIEEASEKLQLVNGKYVTEQEAKQIERDKINSLSMTPLDFIKALEKFAGITYAQVKELCDTYPEIDRELRFCQNVYRNNPMFSQEALAQLPEEFRLTDEQIDNLFVYVDNLKNGNA